MSTHTILRRAAGSALYCAERGVYASMCAHIWAESLDFSAAECDAASDLARDLFRQDSKWRRHAYWMGPRIQENSERRVWALLLAAAIAKDEGL